MTTLTSVDIQRTILLKRWLVWWVDPTNIFWKVKPDIRGGQKAASVYVALPSSRPWGGYKMLSGEQELRIQTFLLTAHHSAVSFLTILFTFSFSIQFTHLLFCTFIFLFCLLPFHSDTPSLSISLPYSTHSDILIPILWWHHERGCLWSP